jgi:hypothetical protein
LGNLFKNPVVLVILLFAIVVAVVWNIYDTSKNKKQAAAVQETEQAAPKIDLSNADPVDFNDTTKNELDLAYGKAKEENPDNVLTAIVIDFGPKLDPETVVTRYLFKSEADTANNWLITINAVSHNYIRALIPKSDYMGDLTAIDLALIKFNYVTAFQLANQNGGSEKLSASGFSGVEMTLKQDSAKNWLVWNVSYQADSNTDINIDAYSGKVVSQ